MTSADVAGTVLGTVISLGALWVLLYHYVREYRVEYFRASIFALRAELFDLAAASEIRFTDPAYTSLRTTMNGFLRFADRVGLVAVLIGVRARKHAGEDSYLVRVDKEWQAAIADLAPDVRVQIVALRSRMHFEVFKQLLFGSPLILATAIPVGVMLLVRAAGARMVTSFAHRTYRKIETAFEWAIDPLDATAYTVGM